jgi:hypothetical protein
MSLNKTLDRLFDEIRREAKRNPDFADRLDAVLRLHESRRDVPDQVIEEAASRPRTETAKPAKRPYAEARPPQEAPPLNPAGLLNREGAAALTAALAKLDEAQLRALVAEHNLDPAGETGAMDRDALAQHVLGQARRRAERDDKMFDY